MKTLMGTLRKESSSWSHMLGTQIPSTQGFGASTQLSHMALEFGEAT